MTTHTTTVTIDGVEYEVELWLDIAPAEHDVGIMLSYIDDWSVTAVDGNTDDKICSDMIASILNEYGEEAFVDKLHDEDAAEVDDGDYD